MKSSWANTLPVVQIRIARPTDRLEEVLIFYERGIGLRRIGEFHQHEGYTGVMLGLPDQSYHLEFTEHEHGSPCPAPTKDNLLVFYIPDNEAIDLIITRLRDLGFCTVKPENPYWEKGGFTISDPDGWRVVLMNSPGI